MIRWRWNKESYTHEILLLVIVRPMDGLQGSGPGVGEWEGRIHVHERWCVRRQWIGEQRHHTVAVRGGGERIGSKRWLRRMMVLR